MSNMLRNSRGYFLQSHELLPKLGIKHKLPKAGFDPIEIDGVTFKCLPAAEPVIVKSWFTGKEGPKKSSKHRLLFLCTCDKWVPCGRAGQHKCKEV